MWNSLASTPRSKTVSEVAVPSIAEENKRLCRQVKELQREFVIVIKVDERNAEREWGKV